MVIKRKSIIESIDDIEQSLIDKGLMKKSNPNNNDYVNNAKVLEAYKDYHKIKLLHDERDLPAPPLPDIIAKAIIQIAQRRCNSWHVTKGYSQSWKEELISHAIYTATIRGSGFDPTRFDNPFSYLTQIINNALLEELKNLKKELYVKYKSMDECEEFYGEVDEDTQMMMRESNIDLSNEATLNRKRFIQAFEESRLNKKDTSDKNNKPEENSLQFD